MDEPPILVILLIMILVTLAAGFLYLGGTLLILRSSWVPTKSRTRWVAFSVSPYAVLVLLSIAAAKLLGVNTAAPGTADNMGDPLTLVGLMFVAAAIGAHWLVFSSFRAAFPRPSKPLGK